MKKIAAFFAVILLLAVTAILAGPSFVDWNAYRGDVARVMGDATGRKVAIDGDLDLALLPSPHLSANGFRMANVEGAIQPDLLRVSELRLNLAVLPLLRGILEFTSISLVDPEIALERTAEGRASWDFEPQPGATSRAGGGGQTEPRLVQVSVQRVTVTGGVVTWREAGGTPETLRIPDAAIAANGLTSGYRVNGKAAYRDVNFTFDGSVGRVGKDAPIPLSATIALPDNAATLVATLQADLSAGDVRGKVALNAPDAAMMVSAIDRSMADTVPAAPFAAESAVHGAAGLLGLTDLKLRLGDSSGEGTAELRTDRTPSITTRLGFPVLDLDALLASTRKAEAPAGSPSTAPAPSDRFILPDALTAKADITADTVRLRGGLLRDARLSARLEKGVVHLTNAAVRLPGGTDLSLSGRTTAVEGGIGFAGELAAAADNLRAALIWAGVQDRSIPADRLRGFSYTSRLTVASDTIQLTDITARLDATRMTGGATIARRTRPSFGLRLSLDRINLDDYLPQSPAQDGPTGNGSASGQTEGGLFDKFDANFNVSVDSLSWHGETAGAVHLDGKIVNGDATLTSAATDDLAGAAVKASGRISSLSGSPTADLDIAVDGRDPERFARLVGLADGTIARRFGRFRIDGRVAGTVAKANVKATLAALGGSISADGSVSDPRGKPVYDLSVTLENPEGRRLLTLLSPGPAWGSIGPVSGQFGLKGGPDVLAIRNLDFVIGGMTVSGTVDAAFAGTRPKISASLKGGNLALDRFLPGDGASGGKGAETQATRGSARWSRERVDLTSMRNSDLDLAFQLASIQRRDIRIDGADIHAGLVDGILTIDRFTGAAFGGRVAVSGSVDATGTAPQINARVDGTNIEARTAFGALLGFDRLEGPVTVRIAVHTSGNSEFAMVSALAGTATVSGTVTARLSKEERTKAGVAGLVGTLLGRKVKEAGFASDAVVSLLRSFADAPATLSGDANIEKGVARTANLALDGQGARAVTAGTANLPDWTIDSKTTLRRDIDTGSEPYMVVSLKGPLDNPDIATSGTWLRGPAAAPTAPVETQPAPEAPALQPEQPAPKTPEKIDPKQLFLELLKKGLQK